MHVTHLRKEMLSHELLVRGVVLSDSDTVESMRSALRPLLKFEKQNLHPTYPPYIPQNFDYEIEQITQHLAEVKQGIESLSTDSIQNKLAKFQSLQSRLVHLHGRINRISTDDLSVEEKAAKSALLLDVLSAFDSLDTASQDDPNLSTQLTQGEEPGPLNASFANPFSSPSANTSSAPCTLRETTPVKCQNVDKWNLKFSGDPKHLTVHNFLERVLELKTSRHISEKQLFDSAIDLFSGKALIWFRANKSRFHDWEGLSTLLKRHFEPPDYRSRLFKEILERTQDTSETIVEYLSAMQALFRRYGDLTSEAQLDILIRNLSPFYSTQLPVVGTIEELEEECLKLETKKYRADHYVPPSRKRQQFVEPDFAFVAIATPSVETRNPVAVDLNPVNAPTETTRPANTPKAFTCWNCQQTGHMNRDCPNPRKTHCYRCGQPNVTVRSCPKCSVSGNEPRRNR